MHFQPQNQYRVPPHLVAETLPRTLFDLPWNRGLAEVKRVFAYLAFVGLVFTVVFFAAMAATGTTTWESKWIHLDVPSPEG